MNVTFRKSRTISLRLAPEEYERFSKMCSDRGVRSLSDMARIAFKNLIAANHESDPLTFEVRDLRSQLKTIANELDRISEIIDGRRAPKVGG